jgi:hypothetical protein
MKSSVSKMLATAGLGLAAATSANAQFVNVTSDITTSTTWTSNNVYVLKADVFIAPGATLTIQPGTVIASEIVSSGKNQNTRAALIAQRGARLVAAGTQSQPIIFTSKTDYNTWSAANPRGAYRQTASAEWGNLTLLGRGYISENDITTNAASPNANNVAVMEGLVAAFPGDPRVLYGGGQDDDNSGTLSYVSIRYGGQILSANVELNGLALGGVGRETVINNIDVINGVDDGIEIWGGTVNLKYVSIWNIGDDSLDIDQGWRGKIQFGLIVKGYCRASGAQGSGFGDNAIELDGAEAASYQPVTTGVLYNLTVVGNPGTGTGANGSDEATAWRDNCNMQIRQSVFTGHGQAFVRSENPSDGSGGYGQGGTLGFAARWSTPFNYMLGSSGGPGANAPANPAAFYTAQTNGNLCEIKDSVVHNFPNATGTFNPPSGFYAAGTTFVGPFAEANALGVFAAANANVQATSLPMVQLTRGTAIQVTPTQFVSPVAAIDPRAANDAVNAALVAPAPNDGFFTPTTYRGGFSATEVWTCNWTAADNYGFIVTPDQNCATGAVCPADLNDDGSVDSADLGTLLSGWGTSAGDISGNGTTDSEDLGILLSAWGACP